MIIDVHTHYFRPELDFGPSLRADMTRCGVDAATWGDVGERHLETTREADVAVVFTSRARRSGCCFLREWTRRSATAWKNSNAATVISGRLA